LESEIVVKLFFSLTSSQMLNGHTDFSLTDILFKLS